MEKNQVVRISAQAQHIAHAPMGFVSARLPGADQALTTILHVVSGVKLKLNEKIIKRVR